MRQQAVDVGLLLMRLSLGGTFIYHGLAKLLGDPALSEFRGFLAAKGFPLPGLAAWAALLAELGGGVLVLTGIFPRIGAAAIAAVMAVAILRIHWGAFDVRNNGIEYCLNLFVMALVIVLLGGGRHSLGARALFRRRKGEKPDAGPA